jgi:hypothetical protein
VTTGAVWLCGGAPFFECVPFTVVSMSVLSMLAGIAPSKQNEIMYPISQQQRIILATL